MPFLHTDLEIARCPYCKVDKPSLPQYGGIIKTKSYNGTNQRSWKTYACSRCGGFVLASAHEDLGLIDEMYPHVTIIDQSIPEPAASYLQQAIDSLHAPAGSVMLSASAIDAMLKAKGYVQGKLYPRIEKAKDDHLITEEMAEWAHEIRLDANDQRHADVNAPLPEVADAQKCVDFSLALAIFLFVLPARVQRGRAKAANNAGATS